MDLGLEVSPGRGPGQGWYGKRAVSLAATPPPPHHWRPPSPRHWAPPPPLSTSLRSPLSTSLRSPPLHVTEVLPLYVTEVPHSPRQWAPPLHVTEVSSPRHWGPPLHVTDVIQEKGKSPHSLAPVLSQELPERRRSQRGTAFRTPAPDFLSGLTPKAFSESGFGR